MDARKERSAVLRVLLVWESKHGSTSEIAYAIARRLRADGVRVDLMTAADASIDAVYDAYVIGSAVYAGHWMKHAKQFAADYGDKLRLRPVWLFSSGPVGSPPKPEEPPVDVTDLLTLTGAQEHKVFAGKLDPELMSFAERAITRALRAPHGDFREWQDIEEWAATIADQLTREQVRS